MKKFIFKYIALLFVKLSSWDILGFGSIIRQLYQTIRQEEFVLTSQPEIIHVKKGKIRYDLLVFETSEGRVRFNLGRHHDKDRVLYDQYVTN